ncbi:MAG: hypothetical protein R3297_01560 [Desulfobulbales bacterium]|nr:hypothetical protein [Desulfobulbales bacterium]
MVAGSDSYLSVITAAPDATPAMGKKTHPTMRASLENTYALRLKRDMGIE